MAIIESGVNLEDRIKDLEVRNAVANMRNAATSSLAKYDLADQVIDDFQDATGVDASASTNETRNSSNYYSGVTAAGSGVDSYTKLLLNFDNNLTDSSGNSHTVTNHSSAASDVSFSTSWVRPASGSTHSADFGDGINRKLEVAASSDFLFGTDPWSIDFWIHFKGSGEIWSTGHPTLRIFIEYNKLKFVGGGINDFFSSSTLSDNGDYWIAIQRGTAGNGASIRSWVNGTHWGYHNANANAMGSSSANPVIGHTDNWFGRYMDGFRVSKGIARWPDNTNAITVPTAAYVGATYNDMTLISTSTTASAAPDKGDLVFMYEDTAGTASLGNGQNGDIRGYVSRNGGTAWTIGTLVSEGALGTSKIVAFHDLDISGQSSATAMRYKITTHNQSSSKETRITGVALGWH